MHALSLQISVSGQTRYQPNGDQCSNQFKKEEDSSEKYANPLRAQAQVLCINSAASSCPVKAFPLAHRNHYYFRASQNPTSKVFVKNCDITKTTSPLVAGKENEGQTKSNWELGAIERRKNGLQMRKEAEQEDERKQTNMHEVVRKQRQALHGAMKEQQQECKVCK